MSAAAESFGHHSNIHVASTPETHFHASVSLFMSNKGTLDTDNPKTLVNHVLGIGWHGAGLGEIFPPRRQPGQATIAGQLDPFQQPSGQPDSGQRISLVQPPV